LCFEKSKIKTKQNTMTRSEIETAIKDMNQLVTEGRMMEAFEKYYHEDVRMQENHAEPLVSKAANRDRELEFLKNITEFRAAEVQGLGIGDGMSYVTWHYDYSHREWGTKCYTQVSIQHWKEGQIIHEQFIYPN
jgi:ribosomal protein S20